MPIFNITSSPEMPEGLEAALITLMKASTFRGIEAVAGLRSLSPTLMAHPANLNIAETFSDIDCFGSDGMNIVYNEHKDGAVAQVLFFNVDTDKILARVTVDVVADDSKLYIDRSDLQGAGTLYTNYSLMPDNERSVAEMGEFFKEMELKEQFQKAIYALIQGELDTSILPMLVPSELVGCKGHPWMYYDFRTECVYVTLHEPESGKLIVAYSYDVSAHNEKLAEMESDQ